MSTEVGVAYVRLLPSMQGFTAEVRRELGSSLGDVGEREGRQAGAGFASGFGGAIGAIDGFVDRVGATIVSGIETAGIVAGGLLGTALFTGWDRFTTIDDATAALGVLLGDVAQGERLIGQVLDTIQGTPFRLDNFAQLSAQLVGMGVDAQRVPGFLQAIGDAAAVHGGRANQVARQLGDVFGQVSARGRIMGIDLNRMSVAGVDALTILGNHFGVTSDEMREMVSAGAVPATEALDALTTGIVEGSEGVAGSTPAFDGLARSLGDRLSGALMNAGAAIADFGRQIIEPFAPALTAGLTSFMEMMFDAGDRVGQALQGFVDGPGFQAFTAWLADLPSAVGPALERLRDLGPALAPLAAALGAISLRGISSAIPILGRFIPVINPLLAAVAALVAASPQLRGQFMELASAAAPLVEALGDTLMTAVTGLATAAIPLLAAAFDIVIPLVELLAANAGWLVPALLGIVAAVKVWTAVQWLLNTALFANPIGLVVLAIAGLVAGLALAWQRSETFRNVVTGAFGAVADAAMWLWRNAIEPAWDGIVVAFNLVSKVVGLWWQQTSRTFQGVADVAKWLWDQVKRRFNAARAIFGAVVGWVQDMWTGARDRFQNLINFVKGLPGAIGRGLSNLRSRLMAPFRAAFNAVAGLWNRSLGNISFTVPSWVPGGIGGRGWSFPQIPTAGRGGVFDPQSGGVLAVLAEAGVREYALPEPDLDRLLAAAVAATPGDVGPPQPPSTHVRVFIGDQELRGMVQTEISGHDRGIRRRIAAGVGAQ